MEVSFTTTHEQSGCAGRGTSHMLFYNIEFYARLIWLLSLSRTHLLIAEENAELLIEIEYEGTGHISGSWLILLDLFYHGGIFTFYCKEYLYWIQIFFLWPSGFCKDHCHVAYYKISV